MKDIERLINERHSVRSYLDKQIESDKVSVLNNLIKECNNAANLNIQLILDDREVFDKFILHYGRIKNCNNYIALVCKKSVDIEKIGYYGEKIVLKAQELGLNTCWVGGTYSKGAVKAKIESDEKLICIIAIGYGESQGVKRKSKTYDDVSLTKDAPNWYKKGIEYALLAPTAINQQRFKFELLSDNKVAVNTPSNTLSQIDRGIVKYHFELGAGTDNFTWY